MARTRTEGTMERLCLHRKKGLSCRKSNLRMCKNIAKMKFEHRSSEVAWRSSGHHRKYWKKVADLLLSPSPKQTVGRRRIGRMGLPMRVLVGARLQLEGITGRGK